MRNGLIMAVSSSYDIDLNRSWKNTILALDFTSILSCKLSSDRNVPWPECCEEAESEVMGQSMLDTCVKTPSSFSKTGFTLIVLPNGNACCERLQYKGDQVLTLAWLIRVTTANPNLWREIKCLNEQRRGKNPAYTSLMVFLVRIHFLLMQIKMPITAQTTKRLPTRQATKRRGSTGTDTNSLQRSPW